MKNILLGLTSLALALTLIGCGSSGPEETTKEFFDSAQKGDYAKIQKLTTETTIKLIDMSLLMGCKKDKNSCIKEMFGKKTTKVLEVVSENEKSAVVKVETTKSNGKIKTKNIYLVKVDGDWKVDLKK